MRSFLFLFLFIPSFCFSQINVRGVVLDESNRPIPYANLYNLKKSIGTVCDENGNYQLTIENKSILKDSIRISSIGYETKNIAIKILVENSRIKLNLSTKKLTVFEVKAYKYILKEIGNMKKPEFGSFSSTPGSEYACWIPNKKNRVGYIKSASIYVSNLGTPNAPFRLKIYSRNKITKAPEKLLLTKNIILKGDKGNEWVTANLDSMKISIPKEGFFIGVEWLKNSKDFVVKEQIGDYIATHYGQVIGGISERRKKGDRTWYKSYLNGWAFNEHNYDNKLVMNVLNLAVKAEINYKKGVSDRNENTRIRYKKIRNRRLKKYFDVPKVDNKNYPNYSIEKLFQSIYNGFEKDDFSYVITGLCNFDKVGRKEVISELRERKENNEPIFTEKEKQLILKDFRYYIDNLEKAKINSIDTDKYEIIFPNGTTSFLQEKNNHWFLMPLFYSCTKAENN